MVQGFNEILNKTKAAHAARNSERMRYNNYKAGKSDNLAE